MIPYLILLFVTVGLAHVGRRYRDLVIERFTLVVVVGVLVFFAGARDLSVGTDTWSYVGWLDAITSLESIFKLPVEPGFSALVLISGLVSDGYFFYLTAIALVTVFFWIATIYRLVPRYEIAIFVFITLGFYTFAFNGARQGVAIAICFSAFPYLLERKFIRYVAIIAVATLFHKTALIAIPIYFLAIPQAGWRQFWIVISAGLIMSVILPQFSDLAASFIDKKYAKYGVEEAGGGEITLAFCFPRVGFYHF
ncbi:EpsG family protein [Halomonas smyrnensis]|uniref:EpsG family protein n=1 Tax=Halomonas smyrnensis TaxID=720605 RepID=UPI000A061DCD|nr:EpsG family protein [Halomonas smyrnensis]